MTDQTFWMEVFIDPEGVKRAAEKMGQDPCELVKVECDCAANELYREITDWLNDQT